MSDGTRADLQQRIDALQKENRTVLKLLRGCILTTASAAVTARTVAQEILLTTPTTDRSETLHNLVRSLSDDIAALEATLEEVVASE